MVYGGSGDSVFGSDDDASGRVGVVTVLEPKKPILY